VYFNLHVLGGRRVDILLIYKLISDPIYTMSNEENFEDGE